MSTPTAARDTTVALVGPPNTGKSTLFNHLTGARARTANYPGVTVTRTSGALRRSAEAIEVVDLPGTYGLTAASPDEQVVLDHLTGTGEEAPDALLVVLDATTLRRSMRLLAQLLATGAPLAVVLTMTDELTVRGGSLDVERLTAALGVEVHAVVAHRGHGLGGIREALERHDRWPTAPLPPPTEGPDLTAWSDSVLERASYRPGAPPTRSRRLDDVLLHPVWGLATFAAVMTVFFQVIFTVAAPVQGWIEDLVGWTGTLAADRIGAPLLADLVGTALIGGVGGVLVFLPQIALLFLLIAVLEGIGYLPRVAVLMDRVMALSGLDGRAFVAMLSAVACAVPAIMSTRTIPSSRDRLATMLAAPLMPCAARLPVYLLLVGMLVPADARIGPLGAQGLALGGLYLLGGLAAMLLALALRRTSLRSGGLPFYLELPPYRVPTLRSVLAQVWVPVRTFLRKVGTIILLATTVLWALLTFPGAGAVPDGMTEPEAAAQALDASYAATIGRAVEPVIEPLGFDWRIGVGLVGAMAAREVFVTTLGQVAAAEEPEEPAAALAAMTWTDGPRAGEPVLTPPTTAALLVFFVFALQCVSTLAVLRRESNSWRWPAVALLGMGAIAWGAAWVARTITLALQ